LEAEQSLRKHLHDLLQGGGAHARLEEVLGDWPPQLRGRKPAGLPYSPWRILEHMRIAQWDILEFSRDSQHASPGFPDGYWPAQDEPPDAAAWDNSVNVFRDELRQMQQLVGDPSVDLFAKIPHGQGQTILREALVVADHNAYHLGQLVVLRRLLGIWQEA
jgi:DinB superfamily